MKKIALLLALLMLLCCAGCGEKEAEAGQAATGAAGQQETTLSPEEAEDICPEGDGGEHQYKEEIVSEATCTEPGMMMYTCVACDQSVTREIPATGHDGSGASCEEPSICATCFQVAEEAWGHEYEDEFCKNCGTSRDEIEARPVPTFPEVTEPEETEAEETEAEETTEATEAETE